MNLPKQVKEIIARLNENGHEAYVVGGCVRDYLMGAEPKDWDITTAASPEEMKGLFDKTVDTGIEHGTVTVVIDKENYQLTTFRLDGKYLDKRHPEEVTFTKDVEQDLMRRDFTINAIAYHPTTGYLDPFSGQKDIKKKVIRCVLDPDKRFDEDALRMLRCIRFSGQLNFTIQKTTYQALKRKAKSISAISIERIRDEIIKLIMSNNSEKFSLLLESKILKFVNEDLYNHCYNNKEEIINLLPTSNKETSLRLSIIYRHMPMAEVEKQLKFLRLDNNTIKDTLTLLKYIDVEITEDDYLIRKLLNQIGLERLKTLIDLQNVYSKKVNVNHLLDKIISDKDCLTLSDLAIKGNDLLSMGIPKGENIGKTLNFLLDKVLMNPKMNEVEILAKLAKEYNNKPMSST